MERYRILKMMFSKGGAGSTNTKISIPITWARELGIIEDDREVKVSLIDNKIIIEKNIT